MDTATQAVTATHDRGTVTTVIGALARRGLTALMNVEGGTSTDVFLDFVCEQLLPTLRKVTSS